MGKTLNELIFEKRAVIARLGSVSLQRALNAEEVDEYEQIMSLMVDLEANKRVAVDFGDWLLKSGYFISVKGVWGKTLPKKLDYSYFTTEELFQEYLNSKYGPG